MGARGADIQPRGVNRVDAASYVGVGVTKFDEMVADRRMPRPRRIDARKVWDRLELDAAFEALPHDEESVESENPWDRASV